MLMRCITFTLVDRVLQAPDFCREKAQKSQIGYPQGNPGRLGPFAPFVRFCGSSQFKTIGLICLVMVALLLQPPRSSAQTSRPQAAAAPSTQEIQLAIRDLNHPALSKRRAAIRRLAHWGPLAFPELRRASQDRNLESALSARDLLRELESALLLGAGVRLEVSKPSIAWDEPFSVTVVADNPTTAPIRAPWPAPTSQPASAPAMTEAQQVACMMDAADFLVVTGPGGKPIDLRVESIDRDPAVYAAVDQRARGTPPSHLIEPGRQARLVIPLFNRGWARYPLLVKGTYTISFSYQPQWKDESWSADGFGQVSGEPVSVAVKEGAPAALQRSGQPLELTIERAGDQLRAVIISHWDVPLWLNLNFGGASVTHSRLEWQLIPTLQDNADPFDLASAVTPADFEPHRLTRVDPTARVIVDSVSIEVVEKRLVEVNQERKAVYAAQARYVQLSTPTQLRDELTRLGRPHEVPTHLFSGSLVSDEKSVDDLLKK
jgi:hypothetical protein